MTAGGLYALRDLKVTVEPSQSVIIEKLAIMQMRLILRKCIVTFENYKRPK